VILKVEVPEPVQVIENEPVVVTAAPVNVPNAMLDVEYVHVNAAEAGPAAMTRNRTASAARTTAQHARVDATGSVCGM
jgi:hypothetical protein